MDPERFRVLRKLAFLAVETYDESAGLVKTDLAGYVVLLGAGLGVTRAEAETILAARLADLVRPIEP